MQPIHNNPCSHPALGDSPQPQASSFTGQPQLSAFTQEGQGPEQMDITGRAISHAHSQSVSEDLRPVTEIGPLSINPSWKQRFTQHYWLEAGQWLKLSPAHLDRLVCDNTINGSIKFHAQTAATEGDRNMWVLSSILGNDSTKGQGLSGFLSFLNQTRGEVAGHGVLFDAIVTDPEMMDPPLQDRRPTGLFDAKVAATAVLIKPEQINSGWKAQFTEQYWLQSADRLQLSLRHLCMFEHDGQIDRDDRDIGMASVPQDRSMQILNHLRDCGRREAMAHLLNFLNQTRGEVASHGALFDQMHEDPQIMVTACPTKRSSPPADPVVSTGAPLSAQQIDSRWNARFKKQYWNRARKELNLSLLHLGMLERGQVIDRDCRMKGDTTYPRMQRADVVLWSLLFEGGGKRNLAQFLNVLDQSRNDVALHGELFDDMVKDPQIVS